MATNFVLKRDFEIKTTAIKFTLTFEDQTSKTIDLEEGQIVTVKYLHDGEIITKIGRVARITVLGNECINISIDTSVLYNAEMIVVPSYHILDIDLYVAPTEPPADTVETPTDPVDTTTP